VRCIDGEGGRARGGEAAPGTGDQGGGGGAGDGRPGRRLGEERGRGQGKKKMALTCGPHTSAVREREREGREAGADGPRGPKQKWAG
jgi:hypothetical protein